MRFLRFLVSFRVWATVLSCVMMPSLVQIEAQTLLRKHIQKKAPNGQVQANARFGHELGAGRLGPLDGDLYDDVVATAPFMDDSVNDIANMGRAYIFEGPLLNLHGQVPQIDPPNAQPGENLGLYALETGDLKPADPGETDRDEIVLGGPGRNATPICGCIYPADPVEDAGIVYIFDTQHYLDTNGQAWKKMKPPATNQPACRYQSDQRAGTQLSLADVDDDGSLDVVVGAPTAGDGGRVYVYFASRGYTPFCASDIAILEPPDPLEDASSFGWSVATALLNDGDNRSEVIVGEPRRAVAPGRVHVFRGCEIVPGATLKPAQTIDDPASDASASFGWHVRAGRVDSDTDVDLLVYTETDDYVAPVPVPPKCPSQNILNAGSVSIYLQAPSNIGCNTVYFDIIRDGRLYSPNGYMTKGGRSGRYIRVFDVDGDGIVDIVRSAANDVNPGFPPDLQTGWGPGAVYVAKGPLTFPAQGELISCAADWIAEDPDDPSSPKHNLEGFAVGLSFGNYDNTSDRLFVGARQKTVGGEVKAGEFFTFDSP